MTSAWHRSDEPDVAAEKLLEAAEKAFVELGVSAAGMAQIANFAGCSRGTLYRYFESRHALHVAYINREAMRIAELVRKGTAGIADARERLVESILRSVREVRRHPGTAAWFEPGVSELAARMSRSSELVDLFTTSFVSDLHGLEKNDRDSRLRARWMVRIIVSLLTMPGANAAEERALVERFVAPALLPDRQAAST